MTRLCQRCNVADISHTNRQRRYCIPCAHRNNDDNGAQRAQNIVNRAVLAGALPHVSTQACADCAAPAHCYDHRDYNRPLDVEPVCRTCNRLRGAAVPLFTALVA